MKRFLPLIIIIFFFAAIGTGAYFLFSGNNSTPSSPFGASPVAALDLGNGQKVDFSYTDDNTGEDLAIYADKKDYSGLNESVVYFAITPVSPPSTPSSENIALQMIFPQGGAAAKSIEMYSNGAWQSLPLYNYPIPQSDALKTAFAKRQVEPDKYATFNGAQYETTGETQYFRARISFPPMSSGEFWIEAFGDHGSYGLLDPWYSSSWNYRKKISIVPAKVGATGATNFPMLFSRTDTDLKDTGNGGGVASSTAGDILFVDWEGNKVNHEIESYTNTTGALVAWVQVPFVSSTSTRELYMYYGNAAATYQPTNASTWNANYKLVYHLKDGADTSHVNDSTSNGYTGVKTGAGNPAETAGEIGYFESFDGASSYIDTGLTPVQLGLVYNQAFTVNARVYLDATSAADKYIWGSMLNGSPYTQANFNLNTSDKTVMFYKDATHYIMGHYNAISAGQWYSLTVTYDGSDTAAGLKIYFNGINQTASTEGSGVGSDLALANSVFIGAHHRSANNTSNGWMPGDISEFRFSTNVQTADWIKTEYNNQSSPSTFYSVGALEAATRSAATPGAKITARGGTATAWYNASWTYRKKVIINPLKASGANTNFPMLISGTYSDLKDTGSGGGMASSTAGDLVFVDWHGNKINHEIESYTNTTGNLIAWVQMPFLSSTSTRDIYMYYGNASATYQPTNASTWDSSYAGVWHLGETGTVSTWHNSLGINDGTGAGTTKPIPTAGWIGGAAYAGGSGYIYSTITAPTTAFTMEIWAAFNYTDQGSPINIGIEGGTGKNAHILARYPSINLVRFGFYDYASSDVSLTYDTAWHHYVYVFGPRTITPYIDGVKKTAVGTSGDYLGDGTVTFFKYTPSSWFMIGSVDEPRISSIARSADWIKTEYNNQSSPSTFYGVGPVELATRSAATPVAKISARGGTATAWYNASWTYRKKVIINPLKVTAGATNFPMLISRTDVNLKDTGNGGGVASSTAGDLVFVDWHGNKINHEIESYTNTTGNLIAWVQVPFVSSTSTRELYMYYGNAAATYQPTNASTWDSNYKGVWHLKETGTGSVGDYKESTSFQNNSTSTTNQPNVVDGKIGKAQSFNGTQFITVDSSASLHWTTTETLSAWVNIDPSISSTQVLWGRIVAGGSWPENAFYLDTPGPVLGFAERQATALYSNSSVPTGGWHYVTAVLNGSARTVFIDGASAGSDALGGTPDGSSMNWAIGMLASYGLYFKGNIDELHVSATARSADWIKTEYKNQSSPSTFAGFGPQEMATRPAGTPVIKQR